MPSARRKRVAYYTAVTSIFIVSVLVVASSSQSLVFSNAATQAKIEGVANSADTALSVTLFSSASAIDADGVTSARFTAFTSGGSGDYTSYSWIFPSGLRVSSGCTSTSTTCILTSTTPGTYSVSVSVIDSSGDTATSNSITLTVNPALSSVTVSASPSIIDVSHLSTVTVSWSGGTPDYSVTLYSGSSPTSCASDVTSVGMTTVSATQATFNISPSSSAYYCASIADSALASASSSTPVGIIVNSALGTPVVTPSRTSIDPGQQISILVSWTGGTSPYSVKLYSSPTGTCSSSSTLVSSEAGITALQASFSGVSPGSSSIYYCATVTDSSGTPATTTSVAVEVVVNPALQAPTISASPGTIDLGQTSFLTSTAVTTGTSPYSYKWYEEAPGSTTFTQISGAASSSYSFVTTVSSIPGTYLFELVVTDNTGVSVSSNTVSVTVLSTVTTLTISTSLSSTTINAGQYVSDSATLTGATSTAGGIVTYEYFTSASCSGPAAVVSQVTVTNGVVPSSASRTFGYGSYGWEAVYSGDSSNGGATSACEPLTVNRASPSLSTAVAPSSIALGASATDTATLTGGYEPTGTVTYFVFSNSACTTGVGSYQVAVSNNGQQLTSGSFTPSSAGLYYWIAAYSGDSNNNGFTTPCGASGETLTVVSPSTAILTVSCVPTSPTQPHPLRYFGHRLPGHEQAFYYTCTATVNGVTTSAGKITFTTSSSTGSFSPSSATCPIDSSNSCSVEYFDTAAGSVTITATYETSPSNILATATTTFVIPKATTTTALTCSQSQPSSSSSAWTCTASVSGVNPTGTVSFGATNTGGSGTGTFSSSACTLAAGHPRHDAYRCSVTFTDMATSGTVTVTATYSGDGNNLPSSGSASIVSTSVTVACTLGSSQLSQHGQDQAFQYTCTTTVAGASTTSQGPRGIVMFTTSSSTGSFDPQAFCSLDQSGSCSVQYSDTTAGSVTITAYYEGSSDNMPVSGTGGTTFTISEAATSTAVECSSSSHSGSTAWTCTASVSGVNPTGTVSFSAGGGSLSQTSCTLASNRSGGYGCSVTFTDSSTTGTVTITATYLGDSNHAGSSGSTTVNLGHADHPKH